MSANDNHQGCDCHRYPVIESMVEPMTSEILTLVRSGYCDERLRLAVLDEFPFSNVNTFNAAVDRVWERLSEDERAAWLTANEASLKARGVIV